MANTLQIHAIDGEIIVYTDFPANYIESVADEAMVRYPADDGSLTVYNPVTLPMPDAYNIASNATGLLDTLMPSGGSDERFIYTDNSDNITIAVTLPPVGLGNDTIAVTASVGVVATITTASGGSGSYTYEWSSSNTGDPNHSNDAANTTGISIADNGEVSFVAGYYLQGAGNVSIIVTATDANDATQKATATIQLNVANRLRIVSDISNFTVTEGTENTYPLIAAIILNRGGIGQPTFPGSHIGGDDAVPKGFDVGGGPLVGGMRVMRIFGNGNVAFVAGETHTFSVIMGYLTSTDYRPLERFTLTVTVVPE